MKSTIFKPAGFAGLALAAILFITGCTTRTNPEEKKDMYDGPEQAAQFEIERTKDPATGKVPWPALRQAILATETAREFARNSGRVQALSWVERGPDTDFTGPSNGNTRANGGVTSGRVRAVMVDSLDPTRKTVWAGGVDGGLWKTSDITATPAIWTPVTDYLSNLAIAAICQDPRPGFQNIMYFCTGESYFNADAVRGVGVFKSVDGGATWSFLNSTSNYLYGTRILCDYEGNVYLATRGNGLLRSMDGGASWTTITPSGLNTNICDLEISSTAGPARLHVVSGINSTQAYRYTDNPAAVTTGGWTAPVTAFPSYTNRAEIAVNGNVLYALPANNSDQAPNVFKSIDGGANWAQTAGNTPNTVSGTPFANGQGWYDLSVRINPANPNECIVGAIDCAKTIDGGTTWTRISAWVGTTGQYVHADQHDIQWWDGGNKLVFACDGGIHYSADGGTTIRDRNVGLRIKQFYSVAVHPTATNHFLCGAQDNGTHLLTNAGMGASVEVTGGDGAYTAIDQNEPAFQFGSYVYNRYRRSTNGGTSWSSVNFIMGTSSSAQDFGRFINPWDYDNTANIIYAAGRADSVFRWSNPQSLASGSYYRSSPGWPSTAEMIRVAGLNGGTVSAVSVSPYTANRVWLGTSAGVLVRLDNANSATPTETVITPAGASGYLNCIITGLSDDNLIACYSSYNVNNVWLSTNGGTSWTAVDGNLPNMPVRWAVFHPEDNAKAYIATETGVWETDQLNGASTIWNANGTFPNVRTDMIKYRPSDRTIAAATHGRGLFTATIPPQSGFSFGSTTPATATCPAPASMQVTLPVVSNGGFTNPVTLSAIAGVPFGTSISFGTNPVVPGNSSVLTLSNTNTLAPGTYTITIQGTATGASNQTAAVTFTINPGGAPVISTQPQSQTVCEGQNVNFSVVSSGSYQWQISTNGGTNWSNISGQTTASFSITGVTASLNNNQYRCVVTNNCGTTNSNAAILTVSASALISSQPSSLTVCEGSPASFCVTASGAGLTYQWEMSAAGCAGPWTDVAGATSACLNISAVSTAMNNRAYRCKVTSTCGPSTITTACATLTVVSPAAITAQPLSQVICDGGNTAFSVTASGSGLLYQWQVNNGAGYANISNGGIYSGAATATLTVSGAGTGMNGYQYRCLVSNTTCTTPVSSNGANLTVNALPFISSQPAAQTICAGSGTTFSVSASGTGISYQWQVDNGTGYANISDGGVYSGTNTATLTVSGATTAMNSYQYRCAVTGTCAPAAISSAAQLTVHAPVVITSSPANVEICAGVNATFTVSGSSVPAINYQWQVSTDGGNNWSAIAGETSSSYTVTAVPALLSNNRYRCLLSNTTCTTPVASGAALLTVRVVPTIGLSASPLTSLLPGQSTTLTASPSGSTGGTVTTSWTLDSNPLSVTGNSYTATVNNLGDYQVAIRETWPSGLFCSALSPVVSITANVSEKLFIFPSPNDGNFTVSYYNAGGAAGSRWVRVVDGKGAAVFSRNFSISGPYTLIPVNLVQASRGIYYVIVGDASGKKLIDGKVHVW